MTTPAARRTFGPTVLLGIAGAALATAGANQPWAEASTRSPALRTVTADGTDVAAGVLPLALVALAAWGTVLVLRRRARRLVSVVGLLAAGGAAAVALTAAPTAPDVALSLLGAGSADQATQDATAWPFVTAGGALAAAAAFVVALLHAGRWPELSSRYDAPGDTGPADSQDLWKALDEGRDPTV